MNREQAKETAKARMEDYLRDKGINTRKAFRCLNPQHADSHPSMSFDREHNRVKCFACGESYDVFDLIGMDYNLTDSKAIFDKAYELFRIQVDNAPRRSNAKEDAAKAEGQKQAKTGQDADTHTHIGYTHTHKEEADYTAYYEECKRRIADTDYHRGISLEVLERHGVGYEPHFKTRDGDNNPVEWKALIIPTGKGNYQARNTDQNAGHRDRYRKRGAALIFSRKTLQTATRPIFVVEGEIDAMSIEEAGGEAVGLGSLDNIPLLLRMLEARKPSQPLIIALDNEAEPEKQKIVAEKEEQLIDGLKRLEIPYYKLSPYGGYHDANEALLADKEAFAEAVASAENIEQQAEEEERLAYLGTSAGAYLQQFINGIGESVNTESIPTGFETLDKVLDGGFYEGLYTIGAISSLGKTSMIMQIADMVAASGRDVLIFSLEMARMELISKSISRHTLELARAKGIDTSNAKTSRGITDGKRYINYSRTETNLIQDAIRAYGEYAERLFIQEGIGDIGTQQMRETVEKHIRFRGRRPLVICDYLQIISPFSDRATDKQVVDRAVTELKRLSRDYKLPVIAISSFNRNSYKAEAQFESMKESGSIEYSSDIVIGLQLKGAGDKNFDPTAEKRKNPRSVELVILKNRQGRVGDKILFEYYPMFNYFVDMGLSN